jgi:hypothetical protein
MYGTARGFKLRRWWSSIPTKRAPSPEAVMPTLHLPAAHTDTDVALAAEIAAVVGSNELYVSWTHGEGPGLPPEVEAVVREDEGPNPISPVAEVLVAMVQGLAALWHAVVHPPSTRPALPAPPRETTEEFSA